MMSAKEGKKARIDEDKGDIINDVALEEEYGVLLSMNCICKLPNFYS